MSHESLAEEKWEKEENDLFQENCNNFVSQKPCSYEFMKQRSCALLEGLEFEQKLLLSLSEDRYRNIKIHASYYVTKFKVRVLRESKNAKDLNRNTSQGVYCCAIGQI